MAQRIVAALFRTMTEALQRGETIQIVGLGTFKPHTLKARTRSHGFPRYSERVPPKTYATFTPTQELEDSLNVRDVIREPRK